MPAANRKAGADVRGQLQRLGVLRDSGHEHLRGSLVVPLAGSNEHFEDVLAGREPAVVPVEKAASSAKILFKSVILVASVVPIGGAAKVVANVPKKKLVEIVLRVIAKLTVGHDPEVPPPPASPPTPPRVQPAPPQPTAGASPPPSPPPPPSGGRASSPPPHKLE